MSATISKSPRTKASPKKRRRLLSMSKAADVAECHANTVLEAAVSGRLDFVEIEGRLQIERAFRLTDVLRFAADRAVEKAKRLAERTQAAEAAR
jgi:hypothetical protein